MFIGVHKEPIGKQAQRENKNQGPQQPYQQAVVHTSPRTGCVISETLPLPLVLLPSSMSSPQHAPIRYLLNCHVELGGAECRGERVKSGRWLGCGSQPGQEEHSMLAWRSTWICGDPPNADSLLPQDLVRWLQTIASKDASNLP